MSEYENEPIPGLPGILPPGERILWQGSPDWHALARTAFHTRLFAVYFLALACAALASAFTSGVQQLADLTGVAITIAGGVVGFGLINVLAWASARSTIYTLTNRRIVIRLGIALPKCINLPLGTISAVDLALRPDGTGDLPLAISGQQKLGYLLLWPSARPWKIVEPQPMLRAVPQAGDVAALIAATCLAANPHGSIAPVETAAPAFGEAVAA